MTTTRHTLLDGVDRGTIIRHRLALACAVAAQLVLVVWTLVLADTVPTAFDGRPITGRLLGLLALTVARAVLRDIATRASASVSSEVRHHHRRAVARRLLETVGSGRRRTTGEDTSLLGAEIDALDGYLTHYRLARVVATIVPVVVLVIAGFLDPLSMAILLFTGPMLIALLALVGSRTRALADRRLQELAWLRSFHLDMVRGIPTLRVFGRSREGARTIGEESDRYSRSTMDVLRTAFQTSLVIEWAATAATALVAVQVGLRLTGGHIGFGAALAVLLLTPEFFAPLRNLAVEYHAGQTGEAALAHLATIEHDGGPEREVPTVRSTVGSVPTAPPTIEIDALTVVPPDADRPILERASLHIDAGETVAIVGPSGAGKTTFARVLLAMQPTTSGTVRIDGVDLDDLDPAAWRRSLTFVTQRPAILSGTVADAIALSDPSASREAIIAAARTAGADAFVERLPHGYDTPIGEDGLRLSGGQRQRLAIARAVLRAAPLVLLDEFTAHLDPVTEAEVIDRIGPFLASPTTILFTHREAALRLADRVVRLDHGTFVEERR